MFFRMLRAHALQRPWTTGPYGNLLAAQFQMLPLRIPEGYVLGSAFVDLLLLGLAVLTVSHKLEAHIFA